MHFLYHEVPKELRGDVLYPLNRLKDIHPDLYRIYQKRYTGRSYLIEERIPTLDCSWHDVLFFTAVPPETLREAYRRIGIRRRAWHFFQVEPEALDPSLTAVMLQKHRSQAREYFAFRAEDLPNYAVLPKATIEYYRRRHRANRVFLKYHRIPQILYKGILSMRDIRIIEA